MVFPVRVCRWRYIAVFRAFRKTFFGKEQTEINEQVKGHFQNQREVGLIFNLFPVFMLFPYQGESAE
jgi:hypothetical protein